MATGTVPAGSRPGSIDIEGLTLREPRRLERLLGPELARVIYGLFSNRLSIAGMIIVLGFIVVALAAPVLAPPLKGRDPTVIPRDGFGPEPEPPGTVWQSNPPPVPGWYTTLTGQDQWVHILGTTAQQFDIWYGVIWGARTALLAGALGDDPFQIEDILNRLPPGSPAVRAAIDIALHDVWGKRLGQPLYRLLGLNPQRAPETSFTIAIDEPEWMAQRARESGMPIIKIKLGGGDDEAIVRAIRAATGARLRVGANAGWTREQAAALIPRLAQYDIEFVEQPLPAGDVEGLRWLRARIRARRSSSTRA